MSLVESDQNRQQMSELGLLLITLPSFKLYGISQVCKALKVLFKCYYHDYKYPQFRTSLDYQFYNYFIPKLNEVLSKGFSAEIIACRPYIDDLVGKLASGSSPMEQLGRSLELDSSTGKTLNELEVMLKCAALSFLAQAGNGFKTIQGLFDQYSAIAMAETKGAKFMTVEMLQSQIKVIEKVTKFT